MLDSRQSRLPALLLAPVLLAFSFQSSLEVLHPIEEDGPEAGEHLHSNSGDGPAVQDPSHGDFGAHDHHYCAHSNAIGYVATLATSFQRLKAYVPVIREAERVSIRSILTILERGPPSL